MEKLLKIFADYYQFHVLDEQVDPDALTNLWIGVPPEMRVAAGPGIVAVATARDVTVPVTISILDRPPDDSSLDEFDHVTECGLTVKSGVLVVTGTTELFDKAARFALVPGDYRVRVYHSGLRTVQNLQGRDSYLLRIWLGAPISPRVLKCFRET